MDAVTASTTTVAAPLLLNQHTSLMHGWLPVLVQAATAVLLVLAAGWRSRRWRVLSLPIAAAAGIAVAASVHWYIETHGLSDEPAPVALLLWVALSGAAAVVLVLGWRSARRWQRAVSISALPLSLLCIALAVNAWVGYFPTVQNAWNQLTSGPLPDQADKATVNALAAKRALPVRGSVVEATIPATVSHFKHRGELVYLPPAWFASNPPPRLPTVMMIGGEFNTPADWLRAGDAVKTIDDFAAAHGGESPVFVFVDSGGAFNNDTECVNGTRGNAADHLTEDVVPYMVSTFGVSREPSKWGIVGYSMGGTCAVDLTVMHPDLFSTFVDIAGDLSPNSGTKTQTIARLFGGSSRAWAEFDPATVMTKHGRYTGLSGWFAVNSPGAAAQQRNIPVVDTAAVPGARAAGTANEQTVAAESLCALGRSQGIDCAVVAQPGKHDWPYAGRAFASALPWLAGQVGTPGVARISLPRVASIPPRPATPRVGSHR
ncbi:MAG: esterase family protein [Mycobacterium sp.]|nr:esterase family protein [Mycobacterium sp.]